jgi:hypothetical protein
MRRTRIGMGQRREDAAGTEPSPTRISAQSFSAGAKAWEGRVGKDRSSPNSFGRNFTSLRTMWAADGGLSSADSLKSRWGKDGRINNSAERQASFERRTGIKPATPAAAGAAAGSATLKPDDYLGPPGTKKPSTAGVPGARSFSFGGSDVYTWSADQAKSDGLIKPVMAAGYDPSLTGEDYGTLAAEAASKGAGNPAFMAAGGTSNAALARTKQVPFIYSTAPGPVSATPGFNSRFYKDNARDIESIVHGLFGPPEYDQIQML